MENWLKRLGISKEFATYLAISVFVTVIDTCVSRLSEWVMPLVAANTLGVVTGFVIQYFLTARHVYRKQNTRVFAIFFGTFLLALVLANGIVVLSRSMLFQGSEAFVPFLVSKGLSIVLPFFFNYYLRRWLVARFGGESQEKKAETPSSRREHLTENGEEEGCL